MMTPYDPPSTAVDEIVAAELAESRSNWLSYLSVAAAGATISAIVTLAIMGYIAYGERGTREAREASAYSDGKADGQRVGYETGFKEGDAKARPIAYQQGYTVGRDEGLREGKADAGTEQYSSGYRSGFVAGRMDAIKSDLDAAKSEVEVKLPSGTPDEIARQYVIGSISQDTFDAAMTKAVRSGDLRCIDSNDREALFAFKPEGGGEVYVRRLSTGTFEYVGRKSAGTITASD